MPSIVVRSEDSHWVIIVQIYTGCGYNNIPPFWRINLNLTIGPIKMHTELSAFSLDEHYQGMDLSNFKDNIQ
jgi:hypothetical protein